MSTEREPIRKLKTKIPYKGMHPFTLETIQWKPRVYDDPFKFDYERVKNVIEERTKEGFVDDVATIKRNIKTVCRDNPGLFDDFLELLEI